jgi:hypothetical protein
MHVYDEQTGEYRELSGADIALLALYGAGGGLSQRDIERYRSGAPFHELVGRERGEDGEAEEL